MPEALTRAALIKAAIAEMETEDWSASLPTHTLSEMVLDSVLPLIADAIETAPIPFTQDRERMEWGHGVQLVMGQVVRGLMGGG